MEISLKVYGEPIAQPRHKVGVLHGKARTYLPKSDPVHQFKHDLKMAAACEFMEAELVNCPISLKCLFLMSRPQRLIWKKRPMVREPHTSRPDTDNLIKAVKDALTGVVYRDDSLIWSEEIQKMYAAGDERPQTVVTLSWA